MADDILGHPVEEWAPQEPDQGPPLPKFLKIYWPWYKPSESPEEPAGEEMIITGAEWDKAPSTELVEYTLNVTIKNTGGVPLSDVHLIFDPDVGTTPGTSDYDMGEMAPGDSQQVSETFAFNAGTHTLNVYLRAGDVIYDSKAFTFELAEMAGAGNLHGTITSAETGAPVVNAHVAIGCYRENSDSYYWCADDYFTGEYCLEMEPGRYVIWCGAPDYEQRYFYNFLIGADTALNIKLTPL